MYGEVQQLDKEVRFLMGKTWSPTRDRGTLEPSSWIQMLPKVSRRFNLQTQSGGFPDQLPSSSQVRKLCPRTVWPVAHRYWTVDPTLNESAVDLFDTNKIESTCKEWKLIDLITCHSQNRQRKSSLVLQVGHNESLRTLDWHHSIYRHPYKFASWIQLPGTHNYRCN